MKRMSFLKKIVDKLVEANEVKSEPIGPEHIKCSHTEESTPGAPLTVLAGSLNGVAVQVLKGCV